MQKLILISPESSFPNEIQLAEEMMRIDENLRFHLRKPRWLKEDYLEFLMDFSPLFYSRISIHKYPDLGLNFPTIGLHYTENDRSDYTENNALTSTSFHSKNDALLEGEKFDYFFCSPVFTSISKKGYVPIENWDINNWHPEIQEKAVALGGLAKENIEKVKELGFTTFAFLGGIWMSENPLETFKEIYEICQK